MSTNPEDYREFIVIVEFLAFDRECKEHFFDSTHEQCTAFIFKNICNTAVIKKVTKYIIESNVKITGFKIKQD